MTWAVALLAVVSVASPPASRTQDPGVISPTFAWPIGTRASLEIADNSSVLGPGQFGYTRSCQIEVEPHADGLLIACKNAKTSFSPEMKKALSQAEPRIVVGFENVLEYMRVASEFAWVVSPRGEFLGIENGPVLLEGWRRVMGSSKPEGEALEKAEAAVIAQAEAQARQSWALLVTRWTGSELKIGESRLIPSTRVTNPLFGGPALTTGEFGAARWVGCPGNARVRCVELFVRAGVTVDEVVAPAQGAPTAPTGDSQMPRATAKGRVSTVTTLIAEPGTLLPHRLTVRSHLEGLVSANAQTDSEQHWQFTYTTGIPSMVEGK